MPETLRATRTVIGRKKHFCDWCGKPIAKYEAHEVTTFKGDSIYSWRECSRCKERVSEFYRENDLLEDEWTGEAFADWMIETHPSEWWGWRWVDSHVALSAAKERKPEQTDAEYRHVNMAAQELTQFYWYKKCEAEMRGRMTELESLVRDVSVLLDRYLLKHDFGEYDRIADEFCQLCRAGNGGESPCAHTANDLEETHCNPYMLDYIEKRMDALGLLEGGGE